MSIKIRYRNTKAFKAKKKQGKITPKEAKPKNLIKFSLFNIRNKPE